MRMAGETWLKSMITNGKTAGPIPDGTANAVNMMLINRERWKTCRRAADHTVRVWKSDSMTFSSNDFCWRGAKLFLYGGGPASVEYAEVGIMDFRMLPPLGDEVSKKQVFDTYLSSLKDLVADRWDGIATWMLIHSRLMLELVEQARVKYFPNHVVGSVVRYIGGKGEPPQNWKEDIHIMYIQTANRNPAMCSLVLGENEEPADVPRLSENDMEISPLDSSADTIESYRSDHRDYIAKCELRTEVYLHFIDKYCWPGGTALLFFSGLKSMTASAVCNCVCSFLLGGRPHRQPC